MGVLLNMVQPVSVVAAVTTELYWVPKADLTTLLDRAVDVQVTRHIPFFII